ncbi:BTAD domain-containing putative transcriptional regulator [Nonomuraea sp. NPDC049400]|uniref:AfsR/SARP family transcriptional regulator n=1 Tax=Nonomuraea sp. NPDC049400 TaxID=3364352 RepID=UPI0037A78EDA
MSDASGRLIKVGAAKQQAILAVLALCRGRMVTIDRLIGELWQDEPPTTAKASLQTYVYRLRRTLAPLAADGVDLITSGQSYALMVPDCAVDVRAFETAAEQGADALIHGQADLAVSLLREALGLWRGPLMPEIDVELVRIERRRLEELQLTTRELCAEAELRLGYHSRVIPDLERLVRRHPLRETSWAMLMRALACRGRRAEALAAYRRMRGILDEELGVEPTDDVRRLHQDILRGTHA